MAITLVAVTVCTLLAITGPGAAAQRRQGQNGGVDFDCPDEFGYYPHPSDCTKYYVCVFGGALLESCTGGLMYSHDLQTCDWPRNVGCGESGSSSQQGVSTVRVTDSRTGSGSWRGSTPASPSSTRQMQPQRAQPQPQYPLYADELGPAEEAEAIDRQQRVYRGQPPTVGQVQRDRDGLRLQSAVTNSIPLVNSGRAVADKGQTYVTQPQQYRWPHHDDDLQDLTRDLQTTNMTLTRRRRRRRKRATSVPRRASPRVSRLAHPSDFPPWQTALRSTRQGSSPSSSSSLASGGPLQFRDLNDFFSFSNTYLQNPPVLAPRAPQQQFTTPAPRFTESFRPNSSPFGPPQQPRQPPQLDIDTFLERFRAAKASEAARSIAAQRQQQQSFFDLPNVKAVQSNRPIPFDDFLRPQSRPELETFVRSTPAPPQYQTTRNEIPRSQPTLPPKTVTTIVDDSFEYKPLLPTRKPVLEYEDYDLDYRTPAPKLETRTKSPTPFTEYTYFTLPTRPPPSPPRLLPLNSSSFTAATPPRAKLSPIDEFLRATQPSSTAPTRPPVFQEVITRPTPPPAPKPTRKPIQELVEDALLHRDEIARPTSPPVVRTTPPPPPKAVTRRPQPAVVEDATRGPSTPAPRFEFPFLYTPDPAQQGQLPIEQYFTPTHTKSTTPPSLGTTKRFKTSQQFLPSVDDVLDDDDNEYLKPHLSKLAVGGSPTTPRPFRPSTSSKQRAPNPAVVEDVVLITPPPTKSSRGRVSTTTSTTTTTTTTTPPPPPPPSTTTSTTPPAPRSRPVSRVRPTPSAPSTVQTSRRPSRPSDQQDDARQYRSRRPQATTPSSTTTTSSRARSTIRRRPEPAQPTVNYAAPTLAPRAPAPRAPAPQNYTQYDSYYPAYDDEELYRDVDYSSQYQTGGQQQQQQFRGQSPYKASPSPPVPTVQQQQQQVTYAQPQYTQQQQQQQQPQDVFVQPDYNTYSNPQEEVEYASPQPVQQQRGRGSSSQSAAAAASRTTARPSTAAPPSPTEAATPASRRDKQHRERELFSRGGGGGSAHAANEATPKDVSRSRNSPAAAQTGRGGVRARPSTSCEDDLTSNLSSGGCDENKLPTEASRGRGRPATSSSIETSTIASAIRSSGAAPSRTRGSSSYSSDTGSSNNNGRGSVRSRPTLKPSTAIVSQAAEYIDIYRYPPSRPEPIYPTPRADQNAAKCRKDVCLLPDCYCGGKEVPAGYEPEEVPQIVLLTFDDSVNDLNKGLYESLFQRGRVNPNGCPISATFYVSHEWTDYSQVQNLYADGHEMASHSISHSFGEQFSQKKWTREIAGQREILSAYGGVKLEDVRGMRAPFLAVGGNKMFKMLYDANFTYDSSMPIYENRPPSYPYTLDYKLFHDCMIPPCPTRSYPGVWEVPMVMWQDLNGGRCSMGDACSNPPTADGVYKMLIKNFERHYTTNRAPFGLYYHAAWFTHPHHKEGFEAFLDTIVAMDDVWLVTNHQAIQWMRDPQPLSTVKNFRPFGCDYPDRPKRCNNPRVCNLWHKSGVRYMRTCQPCPDIYPWTGKTGVRNSRVDNNEVEE